MSTSLQENSGTDKKRMSKYDCPYLDCDDMFHMTQCLKKHVKRHVLEEQFEKAGFKSPYVALFMPGSCTECEDCVQYAKESHTRDTDKLEAKLREEFTSKPMPKDKLLKAYLELKADAISSKLRKIEDEIHDIREMIYEKYES